MAKKKERSEQPPVEAEPRSPGAGAGQALTALVVVSGGVLMAFEILGSRMLAPFFGNSVFVWGSLIGVFLASLSIGYYLGGHLADRHPSFPLLSAIALLASGFIFVSWTICPPISRAVVAAGAGDRAGPLLAATAVFFLPSVLLGMISPFAIRLSARSLGNIGLHAGRLYAISTMGSILGTLGTTFVLLPAFRVSTILMALGGVLAVVPVLVLVTTRRGVPGVVAGLTALGIVGVWAGGAAAPGSGKPGETVLFEADTPYHHVEIVDTVRGARFMKFNDFYESGITLSPPHASVFPYTDAFHLGPLFRPEPSRVVFLGAGGGIGPRAFEGAYPSLTTIDVVDIDPVVLELAQRYFFLEESGKVRLHAADARMFLQHPGEPYDLIVLDAFTIGGRIPFHLATVEFFQEARARLAPGGVLLMNLNSALEGPKGEIYAALVATFREAFGDVAAFPLLLDGERPGTRRFREQSRNIILAASNGPLPGSAETTARALASTVEGARRHGASRLEALPVGGTPLTDERAPIETMAF